MTSMQSKPRRSQFRRKRGTERALKTWTPRAEAVLMAVYENDVINVDQLHFLVGGSRQTLGRMCARMVEDGYIDPPKIQRQDSRTGGKKTYAYRLGDVGARRLKDQGYDVTAFETSYWRKKNTELGDIHFHHKLLNTAINIGLARAAHEFGGKYTWERESERTTDNVLIPFKGKMIRYRVEPDSVGKLTWTTPGQQHKRWLFIEADRATTPLTRSSSTLIGTSMHKKYLAYMEWRFRKKGHLKLGISGFTVLTVTTSEERARNLRDLIPTEVDPKGKGTDLFWSCAFPGDANFGDFLKPIWFRAGDPIDSDTLHSLIHVDQNAPSLIK